MPKTIKKRSIDILAEKELSWINKRFIYIKKSKLRTMYAIFVIAFIIGGTTAIIWSVVSERHSASEAAPLPVSCIDTDGSNIFYQGKTVNIFQYVYSYGYGYQRQSIVKYDACLSRTKLREYTCDGVFMETKVVGCVKGCREGACIR